MVHLYKTKDINNSARN